MSSNNIICSICAAGYYTTGSGPLRAFLARQGPILPLPVGISPALPVKQVFYASVVGSTVCLRLVSGTRSQPSDRPLHARRVPMALL